MYHVMIVDDEPFVTNGLINFIDWKSLSCDILCSAEDGIEAISMIKSKVPDIVITDIKMPGINGIDLSKFIYENYPSIKVIILTGYAEFNYAKDAIKYNVVDFVLKPAFSEKIIEAVNKAKELIIKQAEVKSKLNKQENQINDLNLEIREKYIYDLINGVIIDNNEIYQKMEQLNIVISNYYVLVFQINKNTANVKKEELIRFSHSIKDYTSLTFKNYNHYNFFFNRQMLCSIVSFDNDSSLEYIQKIILTCEEMSQFVKTNSQFEISIGISSMHKSIVEVSFAYEEAIKSLSDRFFNDSNISVFSYYTRNQSPLEIHATNLYIDKIMSFVRTGKNLDAISSMNILLKEKMDSNQSIDHIKSIGMFICYLCSNSLSNYNLNLLDILENKENVYKQIIECKLIPHINKILLKLINSVSACLVSSSKLNNNIIKMAMEYIHEHYNQDITLSSIANYVHLNGSYLSRMFCKATGKTIIEVITGIRIEKAKEILINNEFKISDVASLVGIYDPTYFSQIFKKSTGMTPSEYKRFNSIKAGC